MARLGPKRSKSRRRSQKSHIRVAISTLSEFKSVAQLRLVVRRLTVKQRRRPLEAPYLAGEMPKCRSIARISSNPVLQNKGGNLAFRKYQTEFQGLSGHNESKTISKYVMHERIMHSHNMLCTND